MADRSNADRVDVYARSLLDIVRSEGHLDEVEDELFRFARIVEGNDDLRMSLANPGLPLERRAAIVDELLDNRGLHVTKAVYYRRQHLGFEKVAARLDQLMTYAEE